MEVVINDGGGMAPGDAVIILDTSNDRQRDGQVKSVRGTTVIVYVPRFQRDFTFHDGLTDRGRFTLVGWKE